MSSFKELGKIPQTLFTGMPQDKLTLTDPTKISDVVRPINNYKRKLVDGIDQLEKYIPGFKSIDGISNDLLATVSSFSSKIETKSLLNRLPGLSDQVLRNLNNAYTLSQNFKDADDVIDIAGHMFNVSPNNMEMAKGLKDIVVMVSDKNFLNNLTNNVKTSLIGTALDIAGHYGYRELADLLISKIDEDRSKRRMWGQAIYSYSTASDLEVIMDGLNNGGLNSLFSLTDDPVSHVLRNFRFDLKKHGTVNANMNRLIEVLDKMDPNWLKTVNGDDIRYNLNHLRNCSIDALNGFDSIDEIRPIARSSTIFPKKTSRDVMRSTYPVLSNFI